MQVNLGNLPPAVVREFQHGRHIKEVLAKKKAMEEQNIIARQVGENRSLDGLGRTRFAVHPTSYHYWGQRLGYECWSDPQFKREFERDNPNVRVKCTGTKTQVGYTGAPVTANWGATTPAPEPNPPATVTADSGSPAQKKFIKHYPTSYGTTNR